MAKIYYNRIKSGGLDLQSFLDNPKIKDKVKREVSSMLENREDQA